MINTFKYAKGLNNSKLLNFNTKQEANTRGHSYRLSKSRCNTSKVQAFFKNRIVDIWNNLPSEVVEADSVNQFKNRINKHWMQHLMKYDPKADAKMLPVRFGAEYVAH